jgi:hypothetical protein
LVDEPSWHLDTLVSRALDGLSSREADLGALHDAGAHVGLYVAIVAPDAAPSIVLTADLLDRMARAGVDLDIDFLVLGRSEGN